MRVLWILVLAACTGSPDPCADMDQDGVCDRDDLDIDGDGCPNDRDLSNLPTLDIDGDGVALDCDLCLGDDALGDLDQDGVCAGTDPDDDEDGCPDETDPHIALPVVDVDGDGMGIDCDPCDGLDSTLDMDLDGVCDWDDDDMDGDGCLDEEDPRPTTRDSDLDFDGIGDECDDDLDGDGCRNQVDRQPRVHGPDVDNDGINDDCDFDKDNDGCADVHDPRPHVFSDDVDSDGLGNDCDTDDDNDGCMDRVDLHPTVDDGAPCLNCRRQWDPDGTGSCNHTDADTDADGCADVWDAHPTQPSLDRDGDGLADDCDLDDDGDGCADATDPQHDLTWTDADGDGIGDDCDTEYDILLTTGSVRAVLQTPHGTALIGPDQRTLIAQGDVVGLDASWLPRSLPTVVTPCDLDGDGYDELIGGFGVQTFAHGQSGFGLEVRAPWKNLAEVGCWDLDGDSTLEFVGMVETDTATWKLAVWNGDGVLLHDMDTDRSPLATAQLDLDRALEIVLDSGEVYDGSTLLQEASVGYQNTHDFQPVDLDEDGIDELVYINRQRVALWEDGSVSWTHQFSWVYDVATIEVDGTWILAVSTWSGLTTMDAATGTLRSSSIGRTCHRWWPVDLDGPKLLCDAGRWAETMVFDPGSEQWSELGGPSVTINHPRVGDMDGDGVAEVLWTALGESRAIVRSLDGEYLGSVESSLCFTLTDLDGDGDVEILHGANASDYEPGLGVHPVPSGVPPSSNLSCVLGRGDLTGDGLPDLVYRDPNFFTWVLDGATGSSSQLPVVNRISMHDFEGDGVQELVFHNRRGRAAVQSFPDPHTLLAQGVGVPFDDSILVIGQFAWAGYSWDGSQPVFVGAGRLPVGRSVPSPVWTEPDRFWYFGGRFGSSSRSLIGIDSQGVTRLPVDAFALHGATANGTVWVGTPTRLRRISLP